MVIIPLLRIRSFLARLRPAPLSAALLVAAARLASAQTSPYDKIIVFGDSLSDVGNTPALVDKAYAGLETLQRLDYDPNRFTNSSPGVTTPGSTTYAGVWHEQLATRFLGLPAATASLNGGLDYAYGAAYTGDGTATIQLEGEGGPYIVVENMGAQVTQYLHSLQATGGKADAAALYIVWGGARDLLQDTSDASVQTTAQNIAALVNRLAAAGARHFIVPNVPPLDATPIFLGDSDYSQVSGNYATALKARLDALVTSLAGQGIAVDLYQFDVYGLFNTVTNSQNYSLYGFTDVTDSAQEANVDVDQYLFWDNLHPTTAGHNQLAQFAAFLLPSGHPAFFSGEANLTLGDYAYLAFPNGQEFGYYTYQFYPYLYHTDLGFEYVIPSTGTDDGVYLYDFKLSAFLYTSPTLYPYLYNFGEGGFYYYFVGTTNPRTFYDYVTHQFVYSN